MSFAPPTILAARRLIQVHVPQLSAVELGIVGDDAHANSGTSYHLGRDALKSSSYSIVESSRDRNGLSNAAAALDIGYFKITVKGKAYTLRDMSAWIVGQCKANAPDTRDIREIIYSLDGQAVKRWDDLGIRSTGDSSHRTHTHISWYRDSEFRSKTSIFTRWFQHIGAIEKEDDVSQADVIAALKSADGKAAIISALQGWTEPNPVEGQPAMRMGGLFRMSDLREQKRMTEILNEVTKLTARLAGAEATLTQFGAVLAEIAARPPAGAPTVAELVEALREVLREGTGE